MIVDPASAAAALTRGVGLPPAPVTSSATGGHGRGDPRFDGTCVRCGTALSHIETDSTPNPDSDATYHDYRCYGPCKADGGAVVVDSDGTVTRLIGPAVDAAYQIGGGERYE